MPVTLRREAVAEIVRRCVRGSDHRDIIVDLIDAIFVSDVITFFEQIISTKIHGGTITVDLYKKHFLDAELPTNDIVWNSGLNIKPSRISTVLLQER